MAVVSVNRDRAHICVSKKQKNRSICVDYKYIKSISLAYTAHLVVDCNFNRLN